MGVLLVVLVVMVLLEIVEMLLPLFFIHSAFNYGTLFPSKIPSMVSVNANTAIAACAADSRDFAVTTATSAGAAPTAVIGDAVGLCTFTHRFFLISFYIVASQRRKGREICSSHDHREGKIFS